MNTKNVTKAIPVLFVLGFVIYLSIAGWDRLNELKTFGFMLGVLIFIDSIFIRIIKKQVEIDKVGK